MLALVATYLCLAGASPRTPLLRVAVERDASSACRANAALVKAVQTRLPAVRVATQGALAADDLAAALFADEAGWHLEVRRFDGQVAMTRTLRRLECAQVGDTSALILERYLEEIAWRGRSVGIEPLPLLGSAPLQSAPAADGGRTAGGTAEEWSRSRGGGQAPALRELGVRPSLRHGDFATTGEGADSGPALAVDEFGDGGRAAGVAAESHDGGPALAANQLGDAGPVSSAALFDAGPGLALASRAPLAAAADAGTAALPEPFLTQLTASVGAGGWLEAPFAAGPAFAAELGAHFGWWRVAALFLAGLPVAHPVKIDGVDRGAVSVQSFLAAATATRCFFEGGALCGGLFAGARVTRGTATGLSLYRTKTSLVTLPELGLYGRFSRRLVGRLEASLDVSVAAPLGSASFVVEGASTAAPRTPDVELVSTLRLGWSFL